jgi:hypothetical protein
MSQGGNEVNLEGEFSTLWLLRRVVARDDLIA